jgi:hypothetical protein
MYRYVLDDTNRDYSVYVNLISSSAGHYLNRRPYVIALIKDVLYSHRLQGERIIIEHDMGRNIGTTDIVDTTDKDTIFYAQASKSNVYLRFARNRYPQTSSLLTIVALKDSRGDYEVSDVWIGGAHPAFPGDRYETSDSREYWGTHAMVQDAQVVQSKSVTKTCPY